jgi:aspartate aminotransferase
MPLVSTRGTNAYTSPIRRLAPYADAAKQRGTKVFHLNIGQPDIPTPRAALTQLHPADTTVLAYSPSNGIASYRKKLPAYYKKFGVDLTPDNIMVTAGASEGILLSFLACLDAGQSVLTTEPLYANYVGFAEMTSIKVRTVTCSLDNGFALPSLEAFKAALTPDVRAILLCNPNNPTGSVYPESMLRELAALALERDIFLFVDEVYKEFCYGETPFFSALNIAGLEKNVVVFDSISKRYSACGARVGAVLSKNTEVLKTIMKYAETRLSPPSFGQMLAEYLIDTDEAYFAAVKSDYQGRRDTLYRRLTQMPGVRCYLPDGAFYVFAELPIDDSNRFCQWLLESFSLEGQTVMLAPGSGFYATKGLGQNEVRIAYVLNETDLNRSMDILEAALKAYNAK